MADLEMIDDGINEGEPTVAMHQPPANTSVAATAEETAIGEDPPVPELTNHDDDSDSKAEPDEEDDELEQILQQDSDCSVEKQAKDLEEITLQEVGNAICRSKRTMAGVKRYDESFEWNLMNLSVNTALRDFGDMAEKA